MEHDGSPMTEPKPPDYSIDTWEFTQGEMDIMDLHEGDRFGRGIVGPPKEPETLPDPAAAVAEIRDYCSLSRYNGDSLTRRDLIAILERHGL